MINIVAIKNCHTITKKELCNILNKNQKWLNRNIFTNDFLKDLNMNRQEYKSKREFNIRESKIIFEHLNIQIIEE